MSYVTDNVDQELQLDKRLSPKLCFYVDTEKIMSSINALQLLQMKGRSLVVLCSGLTIRLLRQTHGVTLFFWEKKLTTFLVIVLWKSDNLFSSVFSSPLPPSPIGGFNQRQGKALPPQILLTLKFGSVYSQENYRNCCHRMSDFKAKKAPNSISAGALPPDSARGARSAPPHSQLTISQPSGLKNNLPPQICIPKSAYALSAF